MLMLKKLVKKILKTIFGSSYPSLERRILFLVRKSKNKYFGLNELDKKIEKYVDYDNGFFVELGANDGVTQSNSLYFELKRNWRGILVEPSPNNFLICKEQRSTNNSIFCNACVSFDYKEKYVDIVYADLMSISKNLNTDLNDKTEHIKVGKEYLKKNEAIFEFGSIARPLNDLLIESNAPKLIDFLSLDVEGAELEVLKGINFEQFKFKYMLIEARDFSRIEEFLSSHGYHLEEQFSGYDYLFKCSI